MQNPQNTNNSNSVQSGLIGITMGCPVGIGPEIILRLINGKSVFRQFRPIVIGDIGHLVRCARELKVNIDIVPWNPGDPVSTDKLQVIQPGPGQGYGLDYKKVIWGKPDRATGFAAAAYITKAVHLIEQGILAGMVTCPISKYALHLAGYDFPGHTEMLASLCNTENYGMMMAGKHLRVSLVTIHVPLAKVGEQLSKQQIIRIIELTGQTLEKDFGISRPRIAVAGFNPHSGETGLFGEEEKLVIEPAVSRAVSERWEVFGPLPPDTVFKMAIDNNYDAVVAMYHDQGLIPFKLVHFEDGVNLTMGLPIIRTSVDHGTAYDIAGSGRASAASLEAAFAMAAEIVANRRKYAQDGVGAGL